MDNMIEGEGLILKDNASKNQPHFPCFSDIYRLNVDFSE